MKTLMDQQEEGRAEGAQPLWIVNAVAVDASTELIDELAATYPDLEIIPDQVVTLGATTLGVLASPGWNLPKINAQDLWSRGHRGQGVVVAVLDTGVDIHHPDLALKYRGGSNSWFDPNGQHATPDDLAGASSGHGTAVTGVLVGGDSSGTAIGVAPDAKWIAVKIFNDQGTSSTSKILQGLQWVMDPDGNPETDDAADIVNGSWDIARADTGPNASCDKTLQQAIGVLRQAGILPVFASGNSVGPVIPAAYPESVAVGATDSNDLLWSQSGRGLTACAGRTVYPNLVAPGVGILTAARTSGGAVPNSYQTVEGTSFAAPHVAGAAALLLGAYPRLTSNGLEALENALATTAVDLGVTGPDTLFGAGRIDALAAFDFIAQNLPSPLSDVRPAPPSDVHVKSSVSAPGTLQIAWGASPSANVTYTLMRNGMVIAEGLTATEYGDTSIADAVSYTYSVSATVLGVPSSPVKGLLGNVNQTNFITADRVDGFDLASVTNARGTTSASANWNEAADLNSDGIVDDRDLAILSTHFGQVMR